MMFRFNGVGCTLLGRFREAGSASFYLGLLFHFCFSPIYPIALFVVSRPGDNWRVYRFHRQISFRSFFSVYGWGSLRLVGGVFLTGFSLLFLLVYLLIFANWWASSAPSPQSPRLVLPDRGVTVRMPEPVRMPELAPVPAPSSRPARRPRPGPHGGGRRPPDGGRAAWSRRWRRGDTSRVRGRRGPHRITINNYGDRWAAVKMRDEGRRTVLSVFVGPRSTAEVRNFPSGRFRLEYALGERWRRRCGRFLDDMQAKSFPDFDEFPAPRPPRPMAVKMEYTITPVFAGKVRAQDVQNEEFAAEKGGRRREHDLQSRRQQRLPSTSASSVPNERRGHCRQIRLNPRRRRSKGGALPSPLMQMQPIPRTKAADGRPCLPQSVALPAGPCSWLNRQFRLLAQPQREQKNS
jgi:hypothetical protein